MTEYKDRIIFTRLIIVREIETYWENCEGDKYRARESWAHSLPIVAPVKGIHDQNVPYDGYE